MCTGRGAGGAAAGGTAGGRLGVGERFGFAIAKLLIRAVELNSNISTGFILDLNRLGSGESQVVRSTILYNDSITAVSCICSLLQGRVSGGANVSSNRRNREWAETVGFKRYHLGGAVRSSYRTGIILNTGGLLVLNAQLVVRRYNKVVRQMQSNFILASQSQRLFAYDLNCIDSLGRVLVNINVVVGLGARCCDNAIHRGQFNSQLRKVAVFFRRILYFNINVGLINNLDIVISNSTTDCITQLFSNSLVAIYLGSSFNRVLVCFVLGSSLDCFILSHRCAADVLSGILSGLRSILVNRCGNRCICNFCGLGVRNLLANSPRVSAVTAGNAGLAGYAVSGRVNGEVTAGNRHASTITYFKCTIDFTTHNSSRSPVFQAICTFVKVFDIIVRQANCCLCTRNYTIRDFFNCAIRLIFIRTKIPNTQTTCCDSATANFANSTPVLDARFICGREYTTANLVYSTLVLKSNKMVLSKRTTRNFINRTTVAEQGRKMTQSQEFAIRNLRNGRTLSIVDYIPAITISAFAVCAIIYASRKLTTFDFGNSTIIIECCALVAYIIYDTTANTIHNCQCTIIGNGMLTSIIRNLAILCSCAVYNLLAIQVESNGLVSRNNNIFNCVFQQSYSIIVSRRNSLSQRLIIGTANLSYRIGFTQLLNSAVILNVTLCNICRNIRGECTAGNFNSIACV